MGRDDPAGGGGEGARAGVLPRARRDVEVTEQVYYGKPCYVLKDPTTLRYYRLRPPEYTIWRMLNGKNALDDVQKVLAERFPQEEFDRQAILNFLIMLRGASLLEAAGPEATEYLLKRKGMQRGFVKKLYREFLFYRIPLLDPDKLLGWLERRWGRVIFSRAMQAAAAVVLLGGLTIVAANLEKFSQRQPILSWINLLYMIPALMVIKVVHEFGHGLACKHFGGEVHEMGVMFLVFMPCAYCDVSDAWMIGEKRKRMWITAAGIVVEVLLAAAAAWVWGATQPKTVLNQLALNVMLAASVNTLLFNGNPLLRYDGYYFLMDLMEMPNLKQKGSGYLWYLLQRHVLGVEGAAQPLDVEEREVAVAGYALASGVYRWVVMFGIAALVWRFLDPYGWGVVGAVLALGCVINALVAPAVRLVRYVWEQRDRMHVRVATAALLAAAAAGGAIAVLALPVEQSVEGQCVLRPAQLHPVYVTRAGFLQAGSRGELVRDGQRVEAGQELLRLSDPQLETQVKDLALQLQQVEIERDRALQARASREVREQLEARRRGVQAQYEQAKENVGKLVIRAPTQGVVQVRTREPLANLLGSFLPVGTAVLAVYEPGEFEAVTAISHRDIGRVQVGQKAAVKLWSLDGQEFQSQVRDKPGEPVRRMSSAAFSTAFGGEVATMPAASQQEALVPADVTYELELPLRDDTGFLRDGLVGRAKLIVEKKTLGWTVYVWLLQTLRQDLRL